MNHTTNDMFNKCVCYRNKILNTVDFLKESTNIACRLEPLKLDDAYRSRWDEEFDPLQVTPFG